jgi:hypothetical protein
MQDIESMGMAQTEPDYEKQDAEERAFEAVQTIAGHIMSLCHEAETAKTAVEERWQKSIRQYEGVYELGDLPSGSVAAKVFVKATRAKVDKVRARLYDTLFPSDEQNWDIQPTPQPALDRDIKNGTGDPEAAKQLQEKAQAACDAMRELIDDQLSEADYSAVFRDVIDDWTLYGVGIVKGPVTETCSHGAWVRDQTGSYTLAEGGHIKPVIVRVDPLSFFPDPNATSIKDAEYVCERRLMTRSQMRKLASDPDINKRALREVLKAGPLESMPTVYNSGQTELTNIRNKKDKITVWEWHGSLTAADVRQIANAYGDEALSGLYADDDPLVDIPVVALVSNNQVLKLSPAPLDTGECVYSVVAYVRIENSIWGLSECDLIRDSQTALNSAWRSVLDNSALSTRPQLVVDDSVIQPTDGDFSITPGKVWRRTKDAIPPQFPPFELFKIEGFQNEILQMVATAKEFMDMESCLPAWSEPEPGATPNNTAFGTAMMVSSANVNFKRLLKNFDDDITKPIIRRFYQWNMQFSPDETVKGDMRVIAKGSTSLMAREMRGQTIMAMMQFGQQPNLAPLIKQDELLREAFRANMLDPDRFLKSEAELQQDAEAAAQQGGMVDPALQRDELKAQTQLQLAEIDSNTRLQLADITRETAMLKLSSDLNISMADIEAMLTNAQAERDHKERSQAAETAFKARQTSIETTTGADVPDGTRFAG